MSHRQARESLLWGVRMHCNSYSLLSAVQNTTAFAKGFKGFNVAQMQRSESLRYQDKNRLSFILYLKKSENTYSIKMKLGAGKM